MVRRKNFTKYLEFTTRKYILKKTKEFSEIANPIHRAAWYLFYVKSMQTVQRVLFPCPTPFDIQNPDASNRTSPSSRPP